MLRVKAGQLSELKELFDRYQVRMYNYFLKLSFDTGASEDMTQNLFYRIIKYRKSFQYEQGSFKSWIYQIARNVHVDYFKQKRKHLQTIVNVDEYADQVQETERAYSEDELERLNNAMLELPDHHRELIVLSRYQGLKYEEIARIKDMSIGAIKVQIHRSIRQLKKIYFKQ